MSLTDWSPTVPQWNATAAFFRQSPPLQQKQIRSECCICYRFLLLRNLQSTLHSKITNC